MGIDVVVPIVGALCAAIGGVSVKVISTVNKGKHDSREQDIKHDAVLVGVIKDNTAMLSKLYELLNTIDKSCLSCKREHAESISDIGSKLDNAIMMVKDLSTDIRMMNREVSTLQNIVEKRRNLDAETEKV